MRPKRVDANHAAIRDGLRKRYGKDAVWDSSSWHGGAPDLHAVVAGVGFHLEIKNPERASTMTDKELAFQAFCERAGNWHYLVVNSEEDATEQIDGILLKTYGALD